MPERTSDRTIFSLSEVALSIQRTLSDRYYNAFWVKADLNKLNRYPHSGHCYPDLVEKADGKIIAEIRANIWKDDYEQINGRFIEILREPLKDGISILFNAKITFHPVYGLSLRILDIDPAYSLGELEREKQETISRIRKEGIFDLNKTRPLALLPKRIAVISVQTSKGYADFMKVITENPWGYRIFHMLFPALLQGEKAVESILAQFARIDRVKHHFDAVAIIRGGGGDIGLTCYNNYFLARTIALFPLPVFTGIGHSTNETVTEMVACKNAITPTELADFLIQKFHNFSVPLSRAVEILSETARAIVSEEKQHTLILARNFRTSTISQLSQKRFRLHQLSNSLVRQSVHFLHLTREKDMERNKQSIERNADRILRNRHENMALVHSGLKSKATGLLMQESAKIVQCEKMVEIMDPVHVLKRGYSITMLNDKVLRGTWSVKKGDVLKTRFASGEITSIAQTVNNDFQDE